MREAHHALVDATQAHGINLRNVCRFRLQQLLEGDPILCSLSRRNPDAERFQRLSYGSVP
jgi:hypothetical protein